MTALIAHPQARPKTPFEVNAHCIFDDGGAHFWFEIDHASKVLWPTQAQPERADLLWKTTCFEAFLQPEGQDGYIELNFSPSGRWAAYGFESYRAGMRHAAMATAPVITLTHDRDVAVLQANLSTLPVDLDGVTRFKYGLTAVIEDLDGALSYHALAHPSPAPDFHNAGGFTGAVFLDP